jgi:hypothetical protein
MRNGGLFWGLVLVLLGGLLLMQTMGLLPPGINPWAIFWPLILIVIGVQALINATRRSDRTMANVETLRLGLEGAQRANVQIKYGAGELIIDDRAGPDELINGSFAGGVEHQVRRGTDETILDLRMPGESIPMAWPVGTSGGLNWTVGLNPNIPLSLNLEVGASRNLLRLTNLQVKNLKLQTGASASEIDLPAHAGSTYVEIHSGVAGVTVRVPEGVAARIRTRGGLAGIDVDTNRFPNMGGEYRSADYDVAANRIEMDIESGLGGTKIR